MRNVSFRIRLLNTIGTVRTCNANYTLMVQCACGAAFCVHLLQFVVLVRVCMHLTMPTELVTGLLLNRRQYDGTDERNARLWWQRTAAGVDALYLFLQAKNKFIMLKVLKELSVKGGSAKVIDDTPTTKSVRSNKSLSTQVRGRSQLSTFSY